MYTIQLMSTAISTNRGHELLPPYPTMQMSTSTHSPHLSPMPSEQMPRSSIGSPSVEKLRRGSVTGHQDDSLVMVDRVNDAIAGGLVVPAQTVAEDACVDDVTLLPQDSDMPQDTAVRGVIKCGPGGMRVVLADEPGGPVHIDSTAKPRLPRHPPIWAESRQEICECLEYFRSYQGGVYSKNDIVKGYLLGAFAASRDLFHHDGKFIISHGGGKSENFVDSKAGRQLRSAQDQTASDKSVRALLRNHKEGRPLVLLADDQYALFPFDLSASGYTYVVLGIYWISHAWAEYQPAPTHSSHIVRWKFAFQWCQDQGSPWWPTVKGGIASPPEPFAGKTVNGRSPESLEYSEEFLRFQPRSFKILPSLTPALGAHQTTSSYSCCPGWHCIHCGRLSSRCLDGYHKAWKTEQLQAHELIEWKIQNAKDFWHLRPTNEFTDFRIARNSGITKAVPDVIGLSRGRGFMTRQTFVLPSNMGKIHLITGGPLSVREVDEIFQGYQQQASCVRGTLLTNYFSQNSVSHVMQLYVGEAANTVPLARAPRCVQVALNVIKERVHLALNSSSEFNEVLTAAYLANQKMSDPNQPNEIVMSLILRHGNVLVMEGHGVQIHFE
ncbi:hypothetical protein EDD16DRAFT_1791069 [Pisolithus croceorrhizus]|nr:hypothetical protein EDD16DRAFT_1791069 [Pisolithus croceorrhizus]